ncbi:hypothetical protein F2Q68_00021937 [Brassica cretica]|uniref:RNase H type-1 domain-containing protein n=1 Tax=Brassica cretica TaxID=69181 RepID=A0A8S9FTW7_BRACR|nr:hypothetical protein F2Q68_00021937 [Brassica cretica]
MCSDNLTLIGEINNKTHRKDLLGIIKDIHDLSYVFVYIAFFHIAREENEKADALAKAVHRNSILGEVTSVETVLAYDRDLIQTDPLLDIPRIERYLPEFADQIQSLKPSLRGAEDSYVWKTLPSWTYSTRLGYNSVATNNQERNGNIPDGEFDWIKNVWKTSCSPKMKVFIWSIIQNVLPLGGEPTEKSNEYRETTHIAVTGTFKAVTNRLRTETCLPPTGVPNTILPWVCLVIWKDRNFLIFEGKSAHTVDLTSKGLALAREWSEAHVCTPQGHKHHTIPQLNKVTGVPQPDLQISVSKTDAAWDASCYKVGLAWVLSGSSNPTWR